MPLSEQQITRYARHLVLPEIGVTGQQALLDASVLVIGAGGLGAAMLPYLAAAGIGRIGIVDDDIIDASNLQRQVIYDQRAVGKSKAAEAKRRLLELSPETVIDVHDLRLTAANANPIINDYDIVADGSDNIMTRLAVHDACFRCGVPLVSGSAQGMDGQLTSYMPYLGSPHPCIRCMTGGKDPLDDDLPSCAQAGILGPVAGVMGTLQAVEITRILIGIDVSHSGRLSIFDARSLDVDVMRYARNGICGQKCPFLPDI